jgi:phosphoribosyl 1,2-cyclic phosphate phosphodiesterase
MGQKGEMIFLGTGTSQGVPIIGCHCDVCLSTDPRDKRTRSSVHFRLPDADIQVDTGPDFRIQMLRENLSNVDAVLFTHEHQDHVAGLDDVRPIVFRKNQAMRLFAQNRVMNRIRTMYAYAFMESPYPGVPKFEDIIIDEDKVFEVNGVEITPIPVLHGNLPILGYRIAQVAYITDVNQIQQASMEKLKGLDVLVIDALHHNEHFSHYTLKQAITVARKIGAERTIFVHMSHHMGKHSEISKNLPDGMELSYDGLRVEFTLTS